MSHDLHMINGLTEANGTSKRERQSHSTRRPHRFNDGIPPLPLSLPPCSQLRAEPSTSNTANCDCFRQNSTVPQAVRSSTQDSHPVADSSKCREEKKLLLFIVLFSINLCGIIALLLLWNIKGISNNITWALVAVCGMAGFSVFCCILYFLVCVNERTAIASALCCRRCHRGSSMRRRSTPRFFKNMSYSIKKLKNGFGKKHNIYSVQTVFPTPEFQYFGNSPPATISNPTTIRPKLDRLMSSSKDSQLSGAAFSAMSTAPASSMLDIAEMCGELANQANRDYSSTSQTSSHTDCGTIGSQYVTNNISIDRMTDARERNISNSTASPQNYLAIAESELAANRQTMGYSILCHNDREEQRISSLSPVNYDHSFINRALNEDIDNFEYITIPWPRNDRIEEKPRPSHNAFSSPVSVNMYSGL